MRKFLLLTIILLISVVAVQAVTQYKIDINPEQVALRNPEEPAKVTLIIENQNIEARHFSIIPPIDPRWGVRTDPLTHGLSGITVEGRSTEYVTILEKSGEGIELMEAWQNNSRVFLFDPRAGSEPATFWL